MGANECPGVELEMEYVFLLGYISDCYWNKVVVELLILSIIFISGVMLVQMTYRILDSLRGRYDPGRIVASSNAEGLELKALASAFVGTLQRVAAGEVSCTLGEEYMKAEVATAAGLHIEQRAARSGDSVRMRLYLRDAGGSVLKEKHAEVFLTSGGSFYYRERGCRIMPLRALWEQYITYVETVEEGKDERK